MALKPSISDFFDTLMQTEEVEMNLAEIEIRPKSKIDGLTIREAGEKFGIDALIVSVLEKGEKISVDKASGTTLIKAGNKLIAKIFYLMGLFENWGSGTLKILSDTVQSGKPPPEFTFEAGMFRLVLRR